MYLICFFYCINIVINQKSEENKKWNEREQLLFKSKDFGDDKDRVLQKFDGTLTYFAGDVAYHSNKLDRKFDLLKLFR